mmetsp:Transcript_56869/g.90053  ORF Transcript_56869/g.90053 Transcript_56869/m.90053 type:complete len:111 (+) Transcript_56869:719-1051(+)
MQVLELELQKLQLGKQLKLWLELEPSEPLKAASQAMVQPMPLMGPTSLQGLEQLPLLALLVAQLVAQLLVAPVVVARLVVALLLVLVLVVLVLEQVTVALQLAAPQPSRA